MRQAHRAQIRAYERDIEQEQAAVELPGRFTSDVETQWRISMGERLGLDPWEIGSRWTWPRFWLTVRHLNELARYQESKRPKQRPGARETLAARRMNEVGKL